MKQLLLFFSFLAAFGLFAQSDTASSSLQNKIFALHERVMNDPNMQTETFNPQDSTSLPIGIVKEIGGVIYAICIDSARYTPQGAYFNAYMAIDFPGAGRKVAFAAKNIRFNPQGVLVSQGTRLQLVGEQRIDLGPNAQLVFKNDGYNFIEWDCSGYKQAGLSLDFVFNPSIIINASNPALPVKASARLVVQDLQNIAITIPSISPFRVKGAEDFVFSLTNIVIDRSSSINPPGVVLPNVTTQLYNGNISEWKGFYAQSVAVTLPPKLSRSGNPTSVYAQGLIIDDAGVTGAFGATNLFTINEANMSGWAFSLTNLQVQLTCNHVTGGAMAGQLKVPIMDSLLNYTAGVQENTSTGELDYLFTISPKSKIAISAFSSTITVHPTSVLKVQTVNDKFQPKAILNGKWSFEDSASSIRDVAFQNLTIIHTAPVITAGTFSLVGPVPDSNRMMRFPITLNEFGFYQTTANQLKLRAVLGLNLGNAPNTFSAVTSLNILTSRETDGQGRTTLTADRVTIDNIALSLNTTPFSLEGVLAVRKDDPTFGDLFFGSISFKINSVMDSPAMASIGFGKMPDYKYWFVDLAVPVNIPISSTISLTQLYGGVLNRVNSTLSDQQTLARVVGATSGTQPTANPNAAIPFVPNESRGLEFRAGVAMQNKISEETFNGEAMFNIAFNPNGGFASIQFMGTAYMMVARNKRTNPNAQKVYGAINLSYDNNAKIFDAQVDAVVFVPNLLQGNVNLKIHVDPDNWYFWLNRPSYRANLTLVGLFNVNTYFMIGTQLDPLPPPPAAVTNALGSGSFASIDQGKLSSGNGFLTGMQFNTGFNKEFHLAGNWYGYATAMLGAGFDVMMIKVSPTAHCEGSTDPIGINRWYCMGQVYGYLNGGLGARRIKDGEIKQDFNVISLNAAFLLQGRLPKPTFVYGAVALQFQFLTIDVTVSADVEFGNDCQIIY